MKTPLRFILTTLLSVCAQTIATTDPTKFDTTPVIDGGMAPCVTYFDARHLSVTRTDELRWEFGDNVDNRLNPVTGQNVDADNAPTAQIVAHWYENAGTYKGTEHVVGSGGVHAFTVKVSPDTRKQIYFDPKGSDSGDGSLTHPWLTGAKLMAIAQTSNVRIHLAAGMKLTLPGCVQLQSNMVIEGGGSTILLTPGALGFAGTVGKTADILIRHVNFDCVNPANGTQIARIRGSRVAFVDCTMGNVNRGFETADNSTDCVLLQGIVQTKLMASQCFYIGGGHRVIEAFNKTAGSINESPDRADGTALDGSTVEYCDYEQTPGTKAAVTRRVGNDGTVANNKIAGGDLSFNVGIGDPSSMGTVTITNTVARSNLLVFGATDATCRVCPGVSGITLRGNTVQRVNGPAFSVVPIVGQAAIKDVVIEGNTVTGAQSRLLYSAQPAAVISSTVGNAVNGVVAR